jgi:type II secretion system protein G
MKWLYERILKKQRGFTLIELLIVVIILAVLAGIAVPSYLTITSRAKESGTEAEMANIATALELYNADKGGYPVGDLAAMTTALQTAPAYMTTVPQKDKWGNAYAYSGTATEYTLTSQGINSKPIEWKNGQQTKFGSY